MGTAARRVKTDEERAREDLALAGRKRKRAQQRYDAAYAVLKEAEAALKLAADVETHAARHPALRSDEPEELFVGDPSMPPPHEFRSDAGDEVCDVEGCGLVQSAACHEGPPGVGG